jgi:hypothetical protein
MLRCRSEAYRFTWVKSFKESRYSSQRVRVPAEFPQTRRRTITSGPGRNAPEKESSGTKNASNRSRVPIAPGEKRACSGQHVSSMTAGGPRLTKSAGARASTTSSASGSGARSSAGRTRAFPSASQPVAPFPTSSPHCRDVPAKVGTGTRRCGGSAPAQASCAPRSRAWTRAQPPNDSTGLPSRISQAAARSRVSSRESSRSSCAVRSAGGRRAAAASAPVTIRFRCSKASSAMPTPAERASR